MALCDLHLVLAVLSDAIPEMVELPDLAFFLAQDVLIPEGPTVWETPDSLNNILGEHLVDLGFCTSALQAQLVCEDLHKAHQSPSDYQIRVCSHIKQGKSLQAALSDGRSPEKEDKSSPGACALCYRQMPLTWHHLYPRDVQKKFLKRGLMTQQDCLSGIHVCRQCHNTIHHSFDNETLAERLHSLETLKQQEVIQRWMAYAQKQKVRAVVGHRVSR